jgi:hypothetical protein
MNGLFRSGSEMIRMRVPSRASSDWRVRLTLKRKLCPGSWFPLLKASERWRITGKDSAATSQMHGNCHVSWVMLCLGDRKGSAQPGTIALVHTLAPSHWLGNLVECHISRTVGGSEWPSWNLVAYFRCSMPHCSKSQTVQYLMSFFSSATRGTY